MQEENKDRGFVKLYRSMLDWEWYQDSNVKALFIHALIRANFDEQRFQGVTVPRGSFVSSYPSLSKELGISVQSVRTALKKLISTGELTVKKYPKYTLFKVENYESYQSVNSLSNSQSTVNQQATNSQSTPIKEIKKERSKELKNTKGFNALEYINETIPDASLREALVAFVEMRKSLKKPVSTERAMKSLIKSLDELGRTTQEKIEVVDQSTASSWLKFYPLKNGEKYGNNSKPYQDFSDVIGWGPEGNIEQLIQQQREQEQRQNARASAGEGEAMDTGELPNPESDPWETEFEGWDQLF